MVVPLQKIIDLKNQGYDDNTIITTLQQEGYNFADILDAINQANLKTGIAQPLGGDGVRYGYEGTSTEMPTAPPTETMEDTAFKQKITSIIEPLIEEKWEELLKDLSSIGEWKDKSETRLIKLEENMKSLKENFKTLHESILTKIGEYDQHMVDITAELKAIEMVFQKSLPILSENINELSKLVDDLKKSKR